MTSWRRARLGPAGFTLVEILVVLLLLGILAVATIPRIGPDDRRTLEREAVRVAGSLEQASAAAQWRSETLGISAEGGVYRFWRRNGSGEWELVTDDEALRARALPDGVTIRPMRFAETAVAANAILPFRPSGRNEPYALALAAGPWTATIESDPLNRVSWRIAQAATP